MMWVCGLWIVDCGDAGGPPGGSAPAPLCGGFFCFCEGGGLRREVPLQQLGRRVGGERRFAGEELVDDAAEAVDVGPGVERLAADLLGGHVAGGALATRLSAEEFAGRAGGRLGGVDGDPRA